MKEKEINHYQEYYHHTHLFPSGHSFPAPKRTRVPERLTVITDTNFWEANTVTNSRPRSTLTAQQSLEAVGGKGLKLVELCGWQQVNCMQTAYIRLPEASGLLRAVP